MLNAPHLNNLNLEEDQGGNDVSSEHSANGIPDLNVNVIYEVEMEEQVEAAEPQEAAAQELQQEQDLHVVLALPVLNQEAFLPDEIQLDELMDEEELNMDALPDGEPMQQDPVP